MTTETPDGPHTTPDRPNHDIDTWLDVTELLAPGNRNARTFPADGALVHTTGPAGDVVLRRWPAEASAARIHFTAEALDLAHAATGGLVPTIDPVPGKPEERSLLVRGHRFSRSPYLPGRPLGRYGGFRTPSGETIDVPLHESTEVHALVASVARLIGEVHVATGSVATRRAAPVLTLAAKLREVRNVWFEQRKLLGDKAAEQRDIRRWLRCGNRIIPTCSDLLRNEEAQLTDRSVVLHGDLWPAHVLVQGRDEARTITGLVGWTSATAGSPVLDLAALAVHMRGWSAALTEAVVESYSEVAPLTPAQRRLVPVVAALDLVARVAWLLQLAYLDDRMINHPALPVLRSGLKTLLDALEVLTTVLVPDAVERKWERGSRTAEGTASRRPAPPTRPGNGPRPRPRRPANPSERQRKRK